MMIHDSLAELVGGTPMVRLNRVASGLSAQLVAKLEGLTS